MGADLFPEQPSSTAAGVAFREIGFLFKTTRKVPAKHAGRLAPVQLPGVYFLSLLRGVGRPAGGRGVPANCMTLRAAEQEGAASPTPAPGVQSPAVRSFKLGFAGRP